MEADKYRSRILREMKANRANPLNSPPSSTGSRGSLSPTVSSVFSLPNGESTRRLHHDIARVTASKKFPVNWEAVHRKWPDHFSRPADPIASKPPTSRLENKPAVSGVQFIDDDSTQDVWPGSNKTRAEMQPHVDNESDLSFVFSKSPGCRLPPRASVKSTRHPSPLSKYSRKPMPSESRRHSSVSEALDRLRKASLSPPEQDADQRRRPSGSCSPSPPLSSAKSSLTAVPTSPDSMGDPEDPGEAHARSFCMPDATYLGDFVTGTLKFSGSMKNGIPIFVKNGKVHDRRQNPSAGAHAAVDGLEVPRDEEKIFVSMDIIRDEIVTLQEHYDKVQEYAEKLRQKVKILEVQYKSRNFSTENSHRSLAEERLVARNQELDMEVASLRTRLDQTQRNVADCEMEKVTLTHERDRAVSRLQSACDDISKLTRKLSVREKELDSSHKQLETKDQMRQENDTLRRDLLSLKHGRDGLELEIKSLRAENETLRKELKQLREDFESLRSENNGLRLGDGSLQDENKSLRSQVKILTEDNEDLRESFDGVQHEMDAAREQIEDLQRQVAAMRDDKRSLKEDNQSLVRHNDKYFNENKMLRREYSASERGLREMEEENAKLREDVDFLKQQLDHCRPLARDNLSARLDDETDENMTSAFFMPDITMDTNESGLAEAAEATKASEAKEVETPAEAALQNHKTTTDQRETRRKKENLSEREAPQVTREKAAQQVSMGPSAQPGTKVAFSIPSKPAPGKSDRHRANKGSKRRNASQDAAPAHSTDLLTELDTTGPQSVDEATQDRSAMSLNLIRRSMHRDTGSQQRAPRQHGRASTRTPRVLVVEADATAETNGRAVDRDSTCPALSSEARCILDGLCEDNCRNCVVCSRIASHHGVISASEVATGKKRVSVSRPVPVTDRETADDADATVRPSQPPGQALALVINSLEDEAQHLQLELARLQAGYNGHDCAVRRKERVGIADAIRALLCRLEAKNDQIYSLHDVLEGQKAAGQAMNDEELEMTILSITGMTVCDLAAGLAQG